MIKKITITVFLLTTNFLSAQCFKQISNGWYHYLAIDQNGMLWSWGENGQGQLGDGTLLERNSPVQISSDTDWLFVAAGQSHSLALKANGTLWGWGDNGWKQLSNSVGSNEILIPTQIGTDSDWKQVSAGIYGSIGIKTNGTLWTWGTNNRGYLATGLSQSSINTTPTQIGMATDWKTISGTGYHCLAIKENGTLWGWGYNFQGQVGVGTNGNGSDRYTPVQIGADTDWNFIGNTETSSYAIKTDGTLWTWGITYQPIGIGTSTPQQVGTENNWKELSFAKATPYPAALLIKTNGTLWGWGSDKYQRLGNGATEVNFITPTQIGSESNWTTATIGYYESNAVKSNGTFWTWGTTTLNGNSTTAITIPTQYNCTSLNIPEFMHAHSFVVYPNPATDIVNFSQAITAELFDMTGRKVLSVGNEQSANVSGLIRGAYILKTAQGTTQKLMIK